MTRARRGVATLAVALAVALLPAAGASADLEEELAAVLGQIEDLEEQLNATAAQRSGVVAEILETRDRLTAAQSDRDKAERALRRLRVSLAGTEAELEVTQRRLAASYEAIAQTRRHIEVGKRDAQDWARRQYMRQSAGGVVATLVSTDQVSDLGRAMYLLEVATERSTAAIDRYQALANEEQRQQDRIARYEQALEANRQRLAEAEAEQAVLTAAAEEAAGTVRVELDTQQRLLSELDRLIADFETEIEGLDAEQERLERLISEAAGAGGTSPNQLVRPVPGRITSPFGPRLHPILGYTRLHTGVDMTAPLGQEIRAGAAGTVIMAETHGGYGLTVVIDHGGGMTTLYAHQSRLRVGRGDQVDAGQVVGEAGSTGLATGPHLHFEVRLRGAPVDPADYL